MNSWRPLLGCLLALSTLGCGMNVPFIYSERLNQVVSLQVPERALFNEPVPIVVEYIYDNCGSCDDNRFEVHTDAYRQTVDVSIRTREYFEFIRGRGPTDRYFTRKATTEFYPRRPGIFKVRANGVEATVEAVGEL